MGFYKKSGGGVIIDGVAVNEPLKLITDSFTHLKLESLPYSYYAGAVVMLKNEIHILGGASGSNKHYKWNGAEWISVSQIPYSFYYGCGVVYHDEIHIFSGGSTTHHYKWDGGTWIKESTIPADVAGNGCKACVFNDEIHLFFGSGGSSAKNHYKWNGTEWVKDVSCPIYVTDSAVCVYNGELHLTYDTSHYKFDGVKWTSVSTIPLNYKKHCMLELNNELHLIGGNGDYNSNYHYKWNGTAWTKYEQLLPRYCLDSACLAIVGYIHLFGTSRSGSNEHHVLDVEIYRKDVA